jgi:hypothetical protein
MYQFGEWLKRRLAVIIAASTLVSVFPVVAFAQTPTPAPEATETPAAETPAAPNTEAGFDESKLTPQQQAQLRAEIIKLSQNPVGNIAIVPFQSNFNYGLGPYTRWQYDLNIQPVVPLMLSEKMTLIARTIIPIVVEPSFAPPAVCASPAGCGSTFGLSDIQEQLFLAPKTKPGALIWGLGPIFQFPSASPDVLGTGKWSVGPNAVALIMPGRYVIGLLVNQLWSFAGKMSTPPVNSGFFQPFIDYNIPGGQFSLSTAPEITANYEAPGNQKWTVPVGGGVTYTFKLNNQIMQLYGGYYTNVVHPLSGPQTTLRIDWSLLFPVKRGIDIQQLLQEAK